MTRLYYKPPPNRFTEEIMAAVRRVGPLDLKTVTGKSPAIFWGIKCVAMFCRKETDDVCGEWMRKGLQYGAFSPDFDKGGFKFDIHEAYSDLAPICYHGNFAATILLAFVERNAEKYVGVCKSCGVVFCKNNDGQLFCGAKCANKRKRKKA